MWEDNEAPPVDHLPLSPTHLQTKTLKLVPQTLEEARAMVAAMTPSEDGLVEMGEGRSRSPQQQAPSWLNTAVARLIAA